MTELGDQKLLFALASYPFGNIDRRANHANRASLFAQHHRVRVQRPFPAIGPESSQLHFITRVALDGLAQCSSHARAVIRVNKLYPVLKRLSEVGGRKAVD